MMTTGQVETPRDADGVVDYNQGWRLWNDMARYYPSAVHRRRILGDWLAPLRPKSLLDVGCGPGHLIATMRERIPSIETFVGVDYAGETCAENARHMPWARFEPIDLGKQKLDERFDAVTCSEVLEHVAEHEAALRHLTEMTGRHLLITVPTGPLYPLEAGFGHLRHYQLEPLSREIERLGLRVVRAEAWGFPWMTLFKRVSNLRPEKIMKEFGGGEWSWPKKLFGASLTGLFYLNLHRWGPQIFILAERP